MYLTILTKAPQYLQVIEQAVEVGADSSQFPSNWIFHSREKKPGKAFVDGRKIEFINAGGRTSAFVPELQKLSGEQAAKAAVKPQKRSSKKNKDEDDEPESEDEEIAKSAKPKGGKKTAQSRAKNPNAKRKSIGSDEGSSDADADDKKPSTRKKSKGSSEVDEHQKGSKGNKKPPAKKVQESEEDSDDGGEEEGEEKERVQVKGKKEVAKKVQTGRQTKKRAK